MEKNLENLTIGVFAKAAGVNVETIRFYQRKGLLPEPDKPYGSIRRYGEADVTRVRFVKSAQRLGFSLGLGIQFICRSLGDGGPWRYRVLRAPTHAFRIKRERCTGRRRAEGGCRLA